MRKEAALPPLWAGRGGVRRAGPGGGGKADLHPLAQHGAGAVFSLGPMERWLPRKCVDLTCLARLEPTPLERWAGVCALLDAEPGALLRALRTESD